MMEHLKPEEIIKMPLHMQILYYFEQWGVLVRGENPIKKVS
jgi:hypothetical protein